MSLVLQLLAFVGVPGGLLALTMVLRSRERMRLLEVVQNAAAQGHALPADVVRALPRGRPGPSPERDYRRGVLLVAIAAGVALLGFCAYVFASTLTGESGLAVGVAVAAFGAIPGAVGTALIVLSRAGRNARVD
jgi:hypothetical protein